MKVVTDIDRNMNEDRTFLGNGWSFPPALDKDGTPTRMSAYEENIRQSLWTLLSTSPGERVHRYDYGCLVGFCVYLVTSVHIYCCASA